MEKAESSMAGQFLSFILREEHFAVEIYKVREVLDVSTLTQIPRMPEYMSGVINLRGNVVPVVDLGLRLGMKGVEHTVNTCIMIVEIVVKNEDDPVLMGILSDAVQEVLDLSGDQIEPVPKMGSSMNTDFIKGMGRQGEKFMILLDINHVLTSEGEEIFSLVETLAEE